MWPSGDKHRSPVQPEMCKEAPGGGGVELDRAFVGCAVQVLQRATRRNHALAQGGLGIFGVSC